MTSTVHDVPKVNQFGWSENPPQTILSTISTMGPHNQKLKINMANNNCLKNKRVKATKRRAINLERLKKVQEKRDWSIMEVQE